MSKADGMNYAPKGKANRVVKPGEFRFAAIGLDHGHIYGMCNGLTEAGAEIVSVYDPDPKKVEAFRKQFPQAKSVGDERQILEDGTVALVAAATVPADRAALGIRVMESGKDYFTDKAPLTTLPQLRQAKDAVARTGRKYAVYYSERLHNEASVYAGDLIRDGEIGRVLQVIGTGPHRLNAPSRPEWFFRKERYGGILIDIGSHQIEQFLFYTGAKDATVAYARTDNFAHPEHPGLDDFGEANLVADNGASGYFRIDWFTPNGLRTWGDGRAFILGTDGYIEMRKYLDVAREEEGDHVFLVNHTGERHIRASGTVGFPFFGQLILDCLNRTEHAMSQEHAFKVAELCVKAQELADRNR